MTIPRPTPIYRLLHIENLAVILDCGGMYAPNHTPEDTCDYRAIHNVDIQNIRRQRPIACGPGGTVHDYVAFYFGPRSPMLYQLHTGRVEGCDEGQEPLIYAVATVEPTVLRTQRHTGGQGYAGGYRQTEDDCGPGLAHQVDETVCAIRLPVDTAGDTETCLFFAGIGHGPEVAVC